MLKTSMSKTCAFPRHAKAAGFTALAIALGAGGATAGPYVIPGLGPRDAGAYNHQEARTVAASARGYLGGGFIEMLATGLDPTPSRAYAPPPPREQGRRVAAYPEQVHALRAHDLGREIDPIYMRAEVDYPTSSGPGSIIVDTPNKHLYYVKGGGRAVRYGIGVGRPGFEWSGVKTVSRKAEWPDWTPPSEMLARRPDLPRFMAGGPANPLGARALYLGSSLYRIHGTNEPHTIGQNVSSGCIRMMNEDVVDLYGRVHVGTRVVVR